MTTLPPTIESFTLADRPALIALWQEYEQAIGLDFSCQSFENELAELPGRYSPEQEGGLWLAKQDTEVVGSVAYYQLRSIPRIAELKRLYVRPACHGRGLGRQLLVAAIHQAQASGYKAIWLDCLERLTPANRVYQSLGFTRIEPYNALPYPGMVYYGLTL
jgi:putative acetyltransferase